MNIYVGPSQIHDRGILAKKTFYPGEVIEICPVLVIPKEEVANIDGTMLYDYYFTWDEGAAGICLGLGSLYNHSYKPNAEYTKKFEDRTICIVCLKQIRQGEEITVNYNGDSKSQNRVWFDKEENGNTVEVEEGAVRSR